MTEVDAILAEVTSVLDQIRRPTATYRLQFNRQLTFRQARDLVDYLGALGISDVYASPFLQARAGSPHNYDVVDHNAISRDVGTFDELKRLSEALRQQGLGLIVDVVPNHMGASADENLWWRDVLENGPASQYASYFDIDWMPLKPDLAHKVLLPILGDPFGEVLEQGHLAIEYHEGAFRLRVYDRTLPLAPQSYAPILRSGLVSLVESLGGDHGDLQELLSVLTAIENLPPRHETIPERLQERRREKEIIKRRLRELLERSAVLADYVQSAAKIMNGQPGDPRSFDRLDALLQQQAYRLAHWRVAADEINYRRFFDVNELAAICMELPEVFDDAHRLIFRLLKDGIASGLRIDHPDGLYDPAGYLRQLQERRFLQLCEASWTARQTADSHDWPVVEARLRELWERATEIPGSPLGRPLYVVVEKILEHGEPIPPDWPVDGTVGYEFLNALNGVFLDPAGEKPTSATYTRFTGESLNFDELAYFCKRLIGRISMSSELHVLAHKLDRISERNRWTRDFTLNSLAGALREIIAGFQVYRTYVQDGRVLEQDRRRIEQAVLRARRANPAASEEVFLFARELLLQEGSAVDATDDAERRSFAGKFQQITGPIMAKAIEDTAFYRYNRLVSLNEVGGAPQRFGNSVAEFHELNRRRLPAYAYGMSSTSTHDTKRSEDVRARINVLSEIPKVWRDSVNRWSRQHQRWRVELEGEPAPSRNDEYLFYQTLVGIWPEGPRSAEEHESLVERVRQYMLKVAREAKVRTSWVSPNPDYEAALTRFVDEALRQDRKRPFLTELAALVEKVAEHGRWNSLSQLLLKLGSPGTPDWYQGTELWTLTLVDPDNRQPVDFERRRCWLAELLSQMRGVLGLAEHDDPVAHWLQGADLSDEQLAAWSQWLAELLTERKDGRIKLLVTLLGLRFRQRTGQLLTRGEYLPLTVTGPQSDCVVAFARREGEQVALVVVPRLTVRLSGLGGGPPLGDVWQATQVELPAGWGQVLWREIYAGRQLLASNTGLPVGDLLRQAPIALLSGHLS